MTASSFPAKAPRGRRLVTFVPLSLGLVSLGLAACQSAPPASPAALARLDAYVAQSARAAEEAHDYQGAASQYASLREDHPADVALTVGLSRNLRALGRTDEALKAIDEALRQAGAQAPLLLERGKVLIAAGQAERALTSLKEAAERAPDDWQVHDTLGIAHDRLERWEEAKAAYRRALDLSPDNPAVLANLGLSRALAGDLEEGLRLERQAASRPNTSAAMRETIRGNIALLEEMRAGRRTGG